MIEFINKTFGIDNTISIPILVSLIVFITGGISKLLFKSLSNYFLRRIKRKSFKNIIKEIGIKCLDKAELIKLFYPNLKIELSNNISLKISKIPYLELVYLQDYVVLFNSFRLIFLFKFKTKRGINAFNEIWATIDNLKLNEESILTHFEKFISAFKKHETAFGEYMSEFRRINDLYLQPFQDRKVELSEFETKESFDYLVSRDTIIKDWQDIGEPKRTRRDILYQDLVRPMLDLNSKHPSLIETLEPTNILLNAEHEYKEMVNILNVYYGIFENYYNNYHKMHLKFKNALENIK